MLRLLETFKRPAALAIVQAIAPASPARSDRSRLKAAIAALDAAHEAITDASETLARLEEIQQRSDDAARDARDAQLAERDFRASWVRGGCRPSQAAELASLATAATEKAKAAEAAALDAEAVSKEIAGVRNEVESRQSNIRHREDEIAAAIDAILVAEAGPLFARFEAVAAEYRQLRFAVIALEKTVTPSRYGVGSQNQYVCEEVRDRARIRSFDSHSLAALDLERETLESLSRPWRARRAALRADPDA